MLFGAFSYFVFFVSIDIIFCRSIEHYIKRFLYPEISHHLGTLG